MRKITLSEYEMILNKDETIGTGVCYGNINTKTTCLVTCDGKKPMAKNIVLFENIEEAFEIGFRPCKRCQHISFKSNKYTEDWKKELKEYIEENYYYDLYLDELSLDIGISKFHLVRSFKKVYEISPIDFLIKTRLDIAKDILLKENKKVTEVAYEVGFKSYNHFTKSFKKHFNQSPSDIRV